MVAEVVVRQHLAEIYTTERHEGREREELNVPRWQRTQQSAGPGPAPAHDAQASPARDLAEWQHRVGVADKVRSMAFEYGESHVASYD